MKRIAALALFTALAAYPQSVPHYTAIYEATLSGAAGATTLQQPASPTKVLRPLAVQLYCSVACVWTEDSGAAATATASTAIARMPGVTIAPTALFYTASNAAAPTVPINKIVLAAGQTITVPFTDDAGSTTMPIPKLAGSNLTFRVASMSGDVKVTWFWREE